MLYHFQPTAVQTIMLFSQSQTDFDVRTNLNIITCRRNDPPRGGRQRRRGASGRRGGGLRRRSGRHGRRYNYFCNE